jgi:hypothetical protein
MFAIIAAVLFGLALLLNLLGAHLGSISLLDFELAGLMFFALHFAYTRGSYSRRR